MKKRLLMVAVMMVLVLTVQVSAQESPEQKCPESPNPGTVSLENPQGATLSGSYAVTSETELTVRVKTQFTVFLSAELKEKVRRGEAQVKAEVYIHTDEKRGSLPNCSVENLRGHTEVFVDKDFWNEDPDRVIEAAFDEELLVGWCLGFWQLDYQLHVRIWVPGEGWNTFSVEVGPSGSIVIVCITPTPTSTPTLPLTLTPSVTPSTTTTRTGTPTPTITQTVVITNTPSSTPSATATSTATVLASPSATATLLLATATWTPVAERQPVRLIIQKRVCDNADCSEFHRAGGDETVGLMAAITSSDGKAVYGGLHPFNPTGEVPLFFEEPLGLVRVAILEPGDRTAFVNGQIEEWPVTEWQIHWPELAANGYRAYYQEANVSVSEEAVMVAFWNRSEAQQTPTPTIPVIQTGGTGGGGMNLGTVVLLLLAAVFIASVAKSKLAVVR